MFEASCHCGAVRLEITRRPRTVTECNCSICRRYAARWAYYTSSAVRVVCERGSLASYAYGRKTFKYFRCKQCGCVTHYRRVNTSDDSRMAVNVRMMDPDDIASVPIKVLDVRTKRRRA